jgi:hypothetical protein
MFHRLLIALDYPNMHIHTLIANEVSMTPSEHISSDAAHSSLA